MDNNAEEGWSILSVPYASNKFEVIVTLKSVKEVLAHDNHNIYVLLEQGQLLLVPIIKPYDTLLDFLPQLKIKAIFNSPNKLYICTNDDILWSYFHVDQGDAIDIMVCIQNNTLEEIHRTQLKRIGQFGALKSVIEFKKSLLVWTEGGLYELSGGDPSNKRLIYEGDDIFQILAGENHVLIQTKMGKIWGGGQHGWKNPKNIISEVKASVPVYLLDDNIYRLSIGNKWTLIQKEEYFDPDRREGGEILERIDMIREELDRTVRGRMNNIADLLVLGLENVVSMLDSTKEKNLQSNFQYYDSPSVKIFGAGTVKFDFKPKLFGYLGYSLRQTILSFLWSLIHIKKKCHVLVPKYIKIKICWGYIKFVSTLMVLISTTIASRLNYKEHIPVLYNGNGLDAGFDKKRASITFKLNMC